MLLAGLRHQHGFAESIKSQPEQWQRFHLLLPLAGQQGSNIYGVMCGHDPVHGFEYMCCAEVASLQDLPADMGRMRISSQQYAVFNHSGPLAQLGAIWGAICNEWLPHSAYQSAHKPDFEIYDAAFNWDTGMGEIEIWISITDK
ncbi:putative transcriptional regulator YdeE [Iodobacter fluviatilis]|uniref:DNA gyrase inhibitor n=2 Tax=Iodobacter fluviatilis TaxID=537 RepID=A0A377Q8T9_9NEIS|nr:putative transcriptional regulator YdeE [Iodobacter fluviatilis]STQ91150.1 DNA gyrase inhibitor [Iodobacter fluviatilis]